MAKTKSNLMAEERMKQPIGPLLGGLLAISMIAATLGFLDIVTRGLSLEGIATVLAFSP
jgi:hypothetical protein